MFISVIVPCYNDERHVRRCLEGLLAQSYPANRYEIIFVDNNSTDRSAEIARKFPGVIVIQESGPGPYKARNAGLRHSSGDILAFTDADCEPSLDWLTHIHEAMADTSSAAILGGRRFASESLILASLADYEWEKARYSFSQDDPALYYAYTNNMAVRREAFERCGPFVDIVRGGDVIFVSKVVKTYGCNAVNFVPEALIRHLEIDRWYGWHRKMWIYGKSYERYYVMSRTRPLSYQSRLKILRRTIARRGFPLLRAPVLLLSGIAAALAFEAGRWSGRNFESSGPDGH